MTTVMAKAYREHLEQLLQDNESFSILSTALRDLNTGVYPVAFVDMAAQRLGSKDTTRVYGFEDALIVSMLNMWLRTGQLGFSVVDAGRGPYSDRQSEQNNAVLSALPFPFSGICSSGGRDEDGFIEWSRPIHAAVTSEHDSGWALVKPGNMPLEIGDNPPYKMFFAASPNYPTTGIARWPYGSRYIWLLHRKRTMIGAGHVDFRAMERVSGDTLLLTLDPWQTVEL